LNINLQTLGSPKRTECGVRHKRADQLLTDYEEILRQINGDFLSKEENLNSPTPVGAQLEKLAADFSYVRYLHLQIKDKILHLE
jgi:hypothetical protein